MLGLGLSGWMLPRADQCVGRITHPWCRAGPWPSMNESLPKPLAGRLTCFASCTLVAWILGCSDKPELPPASRPPAASQASPQEARLAIRSVVELRKRLVPGMTTNEIIAKWGKPDREEVTGNTISWRYSLRPFPADDDMQGTHVIGMIVDTTNGHVARLNFAYVGAARVSTGAPPEPLGDRTNGGRPTTLKFFAVSTHPVKGGRFIDTEQLPKLGYISSTPELTIDRLKKVTLEQQRVEQPGAPSRMVWAFKCEMDEEVAAQFKAITTTNVGKPLLIVVGDEPIVAPMIVDPIPNGLVDIEVPDRTSMELLRKHLDGMQRTP